MIILLDLNYTLIENSGEKAKNIIARIDGEEYREWVIDAIRAQYVILMTARPHRLREISLETIRVKTGWNPDEAYFNIYGTPPPAAKKAMLNNNVFPKHGRDGVNYLALESNPKTRAMYANVGIPAFRVQDYRRWMTIIEKTA